MLRSFSARGINSRSSWCDGKWLATNPIRDLVFKLFTVFPFTLKKQICIGFARQQILTLATTTLLVTRSLLTVFVADVATTAARRCEAAQWLRRMEPVAVECLPDRPSEEEFCSSLRNGLILCNVLNRVNPGAVPKVRVRSDVQQNWGESGTKFYERPTNLGRK
jgi:hypothetical protein